MTVGVEIRSQQSFGVWWIRSLVCVIQSLTDIICKKGYIHTYNILGCQIGLMYIDNNTILYKFNTELYGSLRRYPLV